MRIYFLPPERAFSYVVHTEISPLEQMVAPVADVVPEGQTEHSLAPETEYVPAAQSVRTPSTQEDPAGHRVRQVRLPVEKDSGGQGVQLPAPEAEYVPAGHAARTPLTQ